MDEITSRQSQYLTYIRAYWKLHGRGPSEAEIAKALQVSPPAVHAMLVKLERLGLITRSPGQARSIRLRVPSEKVPPLEDEPSAPSLEPPRRPRRQSRATTGRLYTLEVLLIAGPLPDEYTGQVIRRNIQIRGDQTLDELHQAIFDAFDRWDEHLYEFQFGRDRYDPDGARYGPAHAMTGSGDAESTTIDALGLAEGRMFGYVFDLGDDWVHRVRVLAVEQRPGRGRYPKVVEKVGDSPPQYPDEEDED